MDINKNIYKICSMVQEIAERFGIKNFSVPADLIDDYVFQAQQIAKTGSVQRSAKMILLYDEFTKKGLDLLDLQLNNSTKNIADKFKQSLEQLQKELEKATIRVKELMEEKKLQLSNYKQTIQLTFEEIDTSKYDQLNRQIAECQKEREELLKQIQHIEQLIKKNNDIQKQTEQEAKLKKQQIQSSIEDLNKLSDQLKQLKIDIANDLHLKQQKQNISVQLSKQLLKQQQDYELLLQRKQALDANLGISNQSIDQQNAIRLLQQQELKDLAAQITKNNSLLTKLKNDSNILIEEINKLTKHEIEVVSKMKQLQKQLKGLTDQIKLQQEENQNLNEQLALQQSNEDQNSKIKQLEQDLLNHNAILTQLTEKNKKLKKSISDLQKKNQQLEKDQDDHIKALKQQDTFLQKQISQLQKEFNTLLEQKNKLIKDKEQQDQLYNTQLSSLNLGNKQLQQSELQDDINALQGELKTLKDNMSQNQTLLAKFQQLINEFLQNKVQIQKQSASIQQYLEDILKIMRDIENVQPTEAMTKLIDGFENNVNEYKSTKNQDLIPVLEQDIDQFKKQYIQAEQMLNKILDHLTLHYQDYDSFGKHMNHTVKYMRMLNRIIKRADPKNPTKKTNIKNISFATQISDESYKKVVRNLTIAFQQQFADSVLDFRNQQKYQKMVLNFEDFITSYKKRLNQQNQKELQEILDKLADLKEIITTRQERQLIFLYKMMQSFLVPLSVFKLDHEKLKKIFADYLTNQQLTLDKNIKELQNLALDPSILNGQLKLLKHMMTIKDNFFIPLDPTIISDNAYNMLNDEKKSLLTNQRTKTEERLAGVSFEQALRDEGLEFEKFVAAIYAESPQNLKNARTKINPQTQKKDKPDLNYLYNKMFNLSDCSRLIKQFPILEELMNIKSADNTIKQTCTQILNDRKKIADELDAFTTKKVKTAKPTTIQSTKTTSKGNLIWDRVGSNLLGIVPYIQPYIQFIMLQVFQVIVQKDRMNDVFVQDYADFLQDNLVNLIQYEKNDPFKQINTTNVHFDDYEAFFIDIQNSLSKLLIDKTNPSWEYKSVAIAELLRSIGISGIEETVQHITEHNKQMSDIITLQEKFLDNQHLQGNGKFKYRFQQLRQLNNIMESIMQ